MPEIRTFTFNPFGERCSLVWDHTHEAVIIDPGCHDAAETGRLTEAIAQNNLTIKAIWLTHGHFDHIYGVSGLATRYGAAVYMHPADKVILDNNALIAGSFGLDAPDVSFSTVDIREGDILRFGESSFRVIESPGHTPGGVCYYSEEGKALFSGDTLFAGSIGRTDNAWGDYDKLIVSIMDKLMGLPGEVRVIPGHGQGTDIGWERTHNPFLQPFNEPGGDFPDYDADGLELSGAE